MNLVWVGLFVLEEYSKRDRRQLKNYMEETRKEKDLPIKWDVAAGDKILN